MSQQMLNNLYSDHILCTISGILRTLAYSEPCLFRHIKAYSIIIVIITFTFFFFTITLHTLQRNLKILVFLLQ